MAQPRAIGVRLGYSIGVSYQHQIGKKSMIQTDIDFLRYGTWGAQGTVTFNWIVPLKSWEAVNWNLYAGIGIGGGYEWRFHTMDCSPRSCSSKWWGIGFAGVAAMIGLEWSFKIPLQFSIEYRPLISPCFAKNINYLFNNNLERTSVSFYRPGLWTSAAAVFVRYKFGGKSNKTL